jgi:hypothetical protein
MDFNFSAFFIKYSRMKFSDKQEIVRKLKLGFSVEKLAIDFNISERTVYRINNQKVKLENFRKENPLSPDRRAFKFSSFPYVEKALKMWFYQQRALQYPVQMHHLQQKALQFFNSFYPSRNKSFNASNGYIHNFLTRNSLKLRNMHGEKLSADQLGPDEFKKEFHQLIDGHSSEQIYNADECGLVYFSLPTKSYTTPEETCLYGRKEKKTEYLY